MQTVTHTCQFDSYKVCSREPYSYDLVNTTSADYRQRCRIIGYIYPDHTTELQNSKTVKTASPTIARRQEILTLKTTSEQTISMEEAIPLRLKGRSLLA